MNEHFIFTRFNLSLGRTGNRNINASWLDRRFEIFERYCLPSVRMQSEQDFKWLVFFDTNTPMRHKKKIQEYTQWQNFIPIYVGKNYKLIELLKQSVLDHMGDETTHIITTRLDNDDAIHFDFVRKVQDQFNEQSFQYVSFPEGYVLSSGKLYRFRYPGNPFNSLIEKVHERNLSGIDTCFRLRHEQTADQAILIDIHPAWLQVVHGENIANRTRGFRQFVHSTEEIARSFSIEQNCISVDNNLLAYCLCLCQDAFFYLLDFAIMQLNRNQFFQELLSHPAKQSIKRRLLRI